MGSMDMDEKQFMGKENRRRRKKEENNVKTMAPSAHVSLGQFNVVYLMNRPISIENRSSIANLIPSQM